MDPILPFHAGEILQDITIVRVEDMCMRFRSGTKTYNFRIDPESKLAKNLAKLSPEARKERIAELIRKTVPVTQASQKVFVRADRDGNLELRDRKWTASTIESRHLQNVYQGEEEEEKVSEKTSIDAVKETIQTELTRCDPKIRALVNEHMTCFPPKTYEEGLDILQRLETVRSDEKKAKGLFPSSELRRFPVIKNGPIKNGKVLRVPKKWRSESCDTYYNIQGDGSCYYRAFAGMIILDQTLREEFLSKITGTDADTRFVKTFLMSGAGLDRYSAEVDSVFMRVLRAGVKKECLVPREDELLEATWAMDDTVTLESIQAEGDDAWAHALHMFLCKVHFFGRSDVDSTDYEILHNGSNDVDGHFVIGIKTKTELGEGDLDRYEDSEEIT